jgi:DNA-binding GntR family transcriptional regulator
MSEDGLKKLENLYRKLEKHAREKNHETYMAVNHRYHTLVQELAGSKVLSEVINGLRQKILLYRYRQIYGPNRLDASMGEHRALQEAFRKKDPLAAERLMKEHLIRQCEVLEGAYADFSNNTPSRNAGHA